MADKSKTRNWSEEKDTCRPYQFQQIFSFRQEDAHQGDEFIDYSIRTIDQDFEQIDGTLAVSKDAISESGTNFKMKVSNPNQAKMKIVIIGGNGLIGSKVAAILRQPGHEVANKSIRLLDSVEMPAFNNQNLETVHL